MSKPLPARPAARTARRGWSALACSALLAACSTPASQSGATAGDGDGPASAVAASQPGAQPAATTTPAGPAAATPGAPSAARSAVVTVYKSPSCGCCKSWVEHMQQHGYQVVVHDTEDMAPVKAQLGVPDAMGSCHTATVGGYVVEGHVPADDIDRLLRERPALVGLAVPGMVTGSPGMEVPGTPADRYDVVTFDRGGSSRVFASH
jgi:hypothetical protein